MKVLVVAPQPFITPRGTPFSVYYRTMVMAESGARIDLLTYGTGQDVDLPGVRIVRIPRLRLLEPVPVGPSWQKAVLDLPMVLWTVGLLLRHRYAVVHAHEESVFWCRMLKPLFRFKLIYDMHSSLHQQLSNFRYTKSRVLIGTFRVLEDTCLRAADAVVTICPALRDHVMQTGIDPARHVMIENSIFEDVRVCPTAEDRVAAVPESMAFPTGTPLIVYAGTFEAYQGIELLVRAFSRVLLVRPDARLLLVGGTAAQVDRIRTLAQSLGLGDRCVLTGSVPKSVAMRHTVAARVLASPRLHGTNTPLKIYEQLASGRPLVATRIESHTQVLDESVCFLADPEPAAFAVALVQALADDAEAARRVRGAQELYRREYSRPAYESKVRRLLEIVG